MRKNGHVSLFAIPSKCIKNFSNLIIPCEEDSVTWNAEIRAINVANNIYIGLEIDYGDGFVNPTLERERKGNDQTQG